MVIPPTPAWPQVSHLSKQYVPSDGQGRGSATRVMSLSPQGRWAGRSHLGRVVNSSASDNPCSSARQGTHRQFVDLSAGLDRQGAQHQERIRPPDSRGSSPLASRTAGPGRQAEGLFQLGVDHHHAVGPRLGGRSHDGIIWSVMETPGDPVDPGSGRGRAV
jgi:hypothetical protein